MAADLEKPTIVLSDHQNLSRFAQAQHLTHRQFRWGQILSDFAFRIYHRPGRLNGKANALSCRTDFKITPGDHLHSANFLQLFHNITADSITILQSDNKLLEDIVTATSSSQLLVDFLAKRLDPDYSFKDSLLYHKDLIVLPSPEL